jgi:hypothetical protein
MKLSFIYLFLIRCKLTKKFKQSIEGSLDVNNKLTSSMMENVTLIGIEALVIGTSATNETVGSQQRNISKQMFIQWKHKNNKHL